MTDFASSTSSSVFNKNKRICSFVKAGKFSVVSHIFIISIFYISIFNSTIDYFNYLDNKSIRKTVDDVKFKTDVIIKDNTLVTLIISDAEDFEKEVNSTKKNIYIPS